MAVVAGGVGFVSYNAAAGTFSMSAEQAAVFAIEDSPVHMAGGFYSLSAIYCDEKNPRWPAAGHASNPSRTCSPRSNAAAEVI